MMLYCWKLCTEAGAVLAISKPWVKRDMVSDKVCVCVSNKGRSVHVLSECVLCVHCGNP